MTVLSTSGEVRVTGDFISGSEATGALIIVYSISDDTIFYRTAQRTADDHLEAVVSDFLLGNQYNLSVFVLKQSGKPFSRAASAPLPVAVPMGIKPGESLHVPYYPTNMPGLMCEIKYLCKNLSKKRRGSLYVRGVHVGGILLYC